MTTKSGKKNFAYDAETDMAYIRLSDDPVYESEEVSAGIVCDWDEAGRLLGMEISFASQNLPPDALDLFKQSAR